jgi:hypothetical protein
MSAIPEPSRRRTRIRLGEAKIFRGSQIDLEVSELSRLCFLSEENVKFHISEAFGLREAVVTPYEAQKGGHGPEKAGLALPVPSCWIEHFRSNGVGSQANEIVGNSGNGHCLDPETGGGNLGYEGVAHLFQLVSAMIIATSQPKETLTGPSVVSNMNARTTITSISEPRVHEVVALVGIVPTLPVTTRMMKVHTRPTK